MVIYFMFLRDCGIKVFYIFYIIYCFVFFVCLFYNSCFGFVFCGSWCSMFLFDGWLFGFWDVGGIVVGVWIRDWIDWWWVWIWVYVWFL